MASIHMLIENNIPKDSYGASDRYLINLCERENIKRDQVANYLLDHLEKDRRDKSVLEGKYSDLYMQIDPEPKHEKCKEHLKLVPSRFTDASQKSVQIVEQQSVQRKRTFKRIRQSRSKSFSSSPLSSSPQQKRSKNQRLEVQPRKRSMSPAKKAS